MLKVAIGKRHYQKRWLFVLPWEINHPGGVNQVVHNLLREFERSSTYQPILLIADYRKFFPEIDSNSEFLTIRARLPSPPTKQLGWKQNFSHHLNNLACGIQLSILAKLLNITVINSHYFTPSTIFLWRICRRHRVHAKLVLSVHGTDVQTCLRESASATAASHEALLESDLIVAPSDALARQVRQFLGDSTHAVRVIYNGVDPDQIRTLSRHGNVKQNLVTPGTRPLVVNLGTFSSVKGHDILIRAFRLLLTEHPTAHLAIAGRRGPECEPTEALVRHLGIQESVQLLYDATHADALALLAVADVFAMPSRSEGFPISILEAAILEIPVVASRVGGIPELIDDELNGLLVQPESPEELARALSRLLSDKILARRLSKALCKRAQDEFSWRRACEAYLNIASDLSI